ncbi:MAG: hypothetical protein ACJ8GJ_09855 [Vitreoscilla sp.]
MDAETLYKFVAFALTLFGARKLFLELSTMQHGRRREEYKFAKEFLDAIEAKPNMHPLLKTKGYRAIAGDNTLAPNEIEYLISLEDPDQTLRDYVRGRKYLTHDPRLTDKEVAFKPKYAPRFARRWRIAVYFVSYAVSAFIAFAPLWFGKYWFKSVPQMLTVFLVSATIFGFFAWQSLSAAVAIDRAAKLVERQARHRQRIILAGTNSTQP